MTELELISSKENQLEFEVEIKGVENPDPDIRFVIHNQNVDFSFPAKHQQDNNWSVNIDDITFLEHKQYQYSINVNINGYYFQPIKGDLTVVGVPEVSAKINSQPEQEEKQPEEQPTPTSVKEQTIVDNSINDIINNIVTRERVRKSPKELAVRKILNQVTIETPTIPQLSEAERKRIKNDIAVRNILAKMQS